MRDDIVGKDASWHTANRIQGGEDKSISSAKDNNLRQAAFRQDH